MNRKTAATLALCMSMSVGAFGQKQVIHLQRTKATVESFVKAIEKQTNMSVDFTQNALNLKRNVTVSSSKLTLAELLDEILRGQGLSYKIMDRHIAIVSKCRTEHVYKDAGKFTGFVRSCCSRIWYTAQI